MIKQQNVLVWGAWLVLGSLTALSAQQLHLDASAPIPPVTSADYQGGASKAPDGATLGVTDRYLTRDGKPWLPVMGEMHFSRVPPSEWEDSILQMKSAGVDIISTYIIWIHHEEVQGQWDWSGQKDLRRFAELCKKHGMLLYPRLGPWAHGEARNGGLPDWVVAEGPIRQTDPKFMAATEKLYTQIGLQLHGLMWKDGGPIIGVQIENEYAGRGPGKGAEYLLSLKKMALDSGFDVPLYTVTGWDNAVVPAREFLPVYGGYPDAPWGASRAVLPPQEVYAFRFGSRVSGNMGMIGAAAGMGTAPPDTGEQPTQRVPFLTAEIGGGMQDTYHRRLNMSADDIAAMMPVMLGSGVNLYGSYMFRGGQNPDGKLTTLQESQATKYPTDVPVKSYDFQAPIGEYGLERQSLRLLKDWDYFLNDFGSTLAPMPAFAPDVVPHGPEDLSVMRWSVRTDGRSGFLFANNYVRGTAMPARAQVQFAITLAAGRMALLPEKPIDIPSGAYFAWPFGLDLAGVPLRYATAQLMMRLPGDVPTYVLACAQQVRCEVALEGQHLDVQPERGVGLTRGGGVTLLAAASGRWSSATVRSSTGGMVRLLLLTPQEAANSWRVKGGLLRTSADVFADGDTATLRQLGDPHFDFDLYPALGAAPHASVRISAETTGEFSAKVPVANASAASRPTKPAGEAPPVQLGPVLSWRPVGVAEAPPDAVWRADAEAWTLSIKPPQLPEPSNGSGVRDYFLRIRYVGDQARLSSGSSASTLLDDDFFNGEPWLAGLSRYSRAGKLASLDLQILPMRSDAPVYLPSSAQSRIYPSGQTIQLDDVTLVPQYQLQLSGIYAKH